jgi:hypothetical protein
MVFGGKLENTVTQFSMMDGINLAGFTDYKIES